MWRSPMTVFVFGRGRPEVPVRGRQSTNAWRRAVNSSKTNSRPSGDQQWFVEQFHLSSPLEEFEEHARLEMDRCRSEDAQFDDNNHRRAIRMVMGKLQSDAAEAVR